MRPEGSVQPRDVAVPQPSTVEVLGVPLALTDYAQTLEWIDSMVAARRRGYVCACNVHTVMASHEDRELHTALQRAALNVPDGQPLRWAINSLGHQVADRVV